MKLLGQRVIEAQYRQCCTLLKKFGFVDGTHVHQHALVQPRRVDIDSSAK